MANYLFREFLWMLILAGLVGSAATVVHSSEKTKEDLWFEAVRYAEPGNIEYYERVKFFLDEGIDVNALDSGGATALYTAVGNKNVKVVKLLLDSGANPNGIQLENNDEFFKNSGKDPIKLLTKAINPRWIPLTTACANGNMEIVKLLLDKGADVNLEEKKGWNPIVYAVVNQRVDVVKLLLESGANTHGKNMGLQKGAGYNSNVALLKALIENGADVNAIVDNYTPLMEAAHRGCVDVVKLLVSSGADVNLKNAFGYTALMVAAGSGNREIVKVILDSGADIDIKNRRGETAGIIAYSNGRHDVVKIIKDFRNGK